MRQHLQQGFPTELMAAAAAERCWSTLFLVDWVAPDTLRRPGSPVPGDRPHAAFMLLSARSCVKV